MKHLLVIGAGAAGISEIDDAREREHWSLARQTFRGFEPRGAVARALARTDGWAVVVPFTEPLRDAVDDCKAVLLWDEVTLPVARPAPKAATRPATQGDLFGEARVNVLDGKLPNIALMIVAAPHRRDVIPSG